MAPDAPSPSQWRLSSVLILPFMLQLVGTVGLVGWLSFQNSQRAIDDLASQLLDETTARIDDQLTFHLNQAQYLNTLNLIAVEREILDPSREVELAQYFWQQLRQFPRLTFVYWGDEQGRFVGSSNENDQLIVGFQEGDGLTYYLPDEQGLPTDEIVRSVETYDARERSWYVEAAAAGHPTWSSIFVWSSNTMISIDSLYPVYIDEGPEQELRGILGISLGLLSLSDFLQDLEIGQTGEAFIIERTGDIVATSTPHLPFIPGSDDQPAARLPAIQSQSPLVQTAARYLQDVFNEFEEIQDPVQRTFAVEGEQYYVEVAPFSVADLDWLIVVTIPTADFMAEIHANTRNTVALTVAALLTALLIGYLTTRQIIRPIQLLISASQDLAQGHLQQRVRQSFGILELNTLATAFNSMASQLKVSFLTLEDRVKERTAELAEANAEIKQLNDRLKAENVRLGAELDIAKRLQQLVLPRDQELESIQGVDIAGYMETADEVGGDYYDVLHTNGILTLAIGDVTGHGLESGILMLMAQTAVRTLQEFREQDPVRFLDTLNRTIFKNVQRMDSDKSLTLAILNYVDGQLSVSGQHEEILVIRVNGFIERIDTMDLGFPIGLDDPIADFVGRARVELAPGDGVVLYTDGITEAENSEGERYEMDRLCQVIAHHWPLTATQIKEAVIQDVKQFIGTSKVYDDITLLILKRLPPKVDSLAPETLTQHLTGVPS